MSICLKLRNPISLVKSHFLKPITTFNSFRVPISGLFTQSKRFNPDKVSHKHLKFLLVLPNGPNGRKLTLAPSSFYLGVRAMLAAKGGRKHFLISSKGSVLFAPTTLCWGQKLGVAQGRWGGGAPQICCYPWKSISIPGFPSDLFIPCPDSASIHQSSEHRLREGQSLHSLNMGPRNTLSWHVEDGTLQLPRAPQQTTQDWDRSWLFFFPLHLDTFYKYNFLFCFPLWPKFHVWTLLVYLLENGPAGTS